MGSKIISRQRLRKYSWLPDVFRVKDSIIPRSFGPIITVTLWAAFVCYLWSIGLSITMTNSVVPLLAVVVGLILVFRNQTSYDRYYEGRKLFGSVMSNIRNLSRLIWISVALPPTESSIPENLKGKVQFSTTTTAGQLRKQKQDLVKLCLCYAFAVKHYLRGEDGLDWDDYLDVFPTSFLKIGHRDRPTSEVPFLGSPLVAPSSPASANGIDDGRETPDATKRVRVKRSKRNLSHRTTLLEGSHWQGGYNAIDVRADVTMPLPLIIAHEISRVLFSFKREGLLETVGPAGANLMQQLVQGLVDHLSGMERIVNTPIPKSYSIHLKQCVTLYLFALPFILVRELGWATVPIVTVVAFTLMGIESIADEIEMPFGHDSADLPLDTYLHDLKEEILYMFYHLPEGGQGMTGYDDGEGDD
ncbi:Bestrophin, RFP-TM, chloride channel-domain-containing protein [Thelephora terrestris]|uniref:Bestrophin, RFP-TM, chloride channel-domain-containing protein n=1 Tax=Thelephora terrestris TaxID=56493 RepID=A0A9P6LCH8_9AGAM|nr:Bestrophin, RFP-TM, chloride channel-domain-containing protein [Thelephora terrestris]